MTTRVVLAYSGGLKASVAIPWLIETHHVEVVAVALDLGQGEDLADVRQRALRAGAIRCHVIDAREEFARDFIIPSVKAGALFEGRYPIPTALARPLIAKTLATIARVENSSTVAHAGTGRDHVRLTEALQTLDPALRAISCAEAWTFTQAELENFAERHHIAAGGTTTRVDRNLWGRTAGRMVDAEEDAPHSDMFATTRSPEAGAGEAAVLAIEFARGAPVALNGVAMPPVELIESLTTIGAEHGIGRLYRVKGRQNDRVSQVVYEAPAAVLLHTAHSELQRTAAPGSVQRFAPTIAIAYADLIDRGEWFSELRAAFDAFVNHIQQLVTGEVRLKLHKGSVTPSGVRQPSTVKP